MVLYLGGTAYSEVKIKQSNMIFKDLHSIDFWVNALRSECCATERRSQHRRVASGLNYELELVACTVKPLPTTAQHFIQDIGWGSRPTSQKNPSKNQQL